jgi:hypothetical protein
MLLPRDSHKKGVLEAPHDLFFTTVAKGNAWEFLDFMASGAYLVDYSLKDCYYRCDV